MLLAGGLASLLLPSGALAAPYVKRSAVWPDRRVKPPFGAAEIDWGHPLSTRLQVSYLLNELGGRLYSLTGKSPANPGSTAVRIAGPAGIGLQGTGLSTDGAVADVPSDFTIAATSGATVFSRFLFTTA